MGVEDYHCGTRSPGFAYETSFCPIVHYAQGFCSGCSGIQKRLAAILENKGVCHRAPWWLIICFVFAPPSPNNVENLLAVSKNLAHPLHPVYDDGKGGGWKWWG